jgi:membrane-bound serine protease (ClpP class)
MIQRLVLSIFLLCTAVLSAVPQSSPEDSLKKDGPVIIVIPVEGTVDPGMAAYLSRALKEAQQYPDKVIILEMDTFGGQVDAAFQMVDTMLNIKNTPTIAYVKTKAISAGALIALSCSKLYMQHNTTIGDCAPLTYGNDGPKMLGEKFQSPLRAKFRTLAKRNNYPERLTEAMVTEGLTVLEITFKDSTVRYLDSTEFAELKPEVKKAILSTKTIDKSNELLTMDDVEAHRLGFSQKSVGSINEMLQNLGYENSKIVHMKVSWSETFVRWMTTIAPILMMIGLAALYMEMKSPGFGIFGVVGIVCLAIVFFSQFAVGLADYTELLIIIVGLGLLVVEIFVLPGFGVIGIAGLLFIAIGLILSLQGFVIPKPDYPWQGQLLSTNIIKVFLSITGSFIMVAIIFRYVFPALGFVHKGPYLMTDLHDAKADSGSELTLQKGASGIADTILRPAGKATINGELYDVVTEGDFINRGDKITVSEIQGNRIVVAKVKETQS